MDIIKLGWIIIIQGYSDRTYREMDNEGISERKLIKNVEKDE